MLIAKFALGLIVLLVALSCGFGILYPYRFIKSIRRFWQNRSSLYLAVLVRLIFAGLLILLAGSSKFPTTLLVIGIISLVTAVFIPVIGRTRIDQLLTWFTHSSNTLIRGWLIFGLVFSAFIAYALV